jgi:hypothetical protein
MKLIIEGEEVEVKIIEGNSGKEIVSKKVHNVNTFVQNKN